ncbi:MAG: hypothetical protein LBV16_04140 [Elusimicrobiota bacterium]|jgi:hypothetical protein|nr:hypothetical protein [Elusimicrobiota bacterium]
MRYLTPIINKPQYWQPLETELMSVFSEIIYKPLAQILRADLGKSWLEMQNAKSAILRRQHIADALRNGWIQYTDDDYIEGKFNAVLTKELKAIGARWDKRRKSFYLPRSKITIAMSQAIGEAKSKFQRAHKDVNKYLDELSKIVKTSDLEMSFENIKEFAEIKKTKTLKMKLKFVIGLCPK